MSELPGLLLLLVGIGALAATGAFAARCLRIRSTAAFLLASYLIAWSWLVIVALALSAGNVLTRGSLLAALLAGPVAASAAWLAAGRPEAAGFRGAASAVRDALDDPAVCVLAVAVFLGALYICALAFFTPANDMDALEYHLARAALWRQNSGLGHIEGVDDARVNLFPPNAEIGQLATMLLASRDRYAALPQLAAYGALLLAVGGLARRVGLGPRESVFASLAFGTLPVVLVQAPSAMNDLVVGSFLVAAAYFALGSGRASLSLFAIAVALAIGTKYTMLVAVPTLALLVAVAQPRQRWAAHALAGLTGCIAGSAWFAVNVAETGSIGTDVPHQPTQTADLSPVPVLVMALRLLISFVDMSGAPWPYSIAFLGAACVLALLGLARRRGSPARRRAFLAASVVTAAVVAMPLIWDIVVRAPFKVALLLGRSDVVERFAWVLNTRAEPLVAWYGPLVLVFLLSGSWAVVVAWRRGWLPSLALVLAAAPLTVVATASVLLSYDVTRGRFLVFGIALAASAWGITLRFKALALAVTAIGSTALFLSLANYNGKPSGLFAGQSIWTMPRWQAQTTRNGVNSDVLSYVEMNVPADARLALSLVGDDWIHPFFGPGLERHIAIVRSDGGSPPADANWLVVGPMARVRRCSGSWSPEHLNANGWRVERRLAPDRCLDVS